jgi:thiol:disulfide interchange protein DsbA
MSIVKQAVLFLGLLVAGFVSPLQAAAVWTEGVNYFLVPIAHPPALPKGQVEVTEIFSYGCPACNAFIPTMRQLQKALPANAVLNYEAAGFIPSEDWPMFQRAFYTAQALGIAAQTHEAMFDAVWGTGELATFDPNTKRLKDPQPTIEDAAKFYNKKTGIPIAKFIARSKDFDVDSKIRQADELIMRDYHVDRTPTIVVNGKYRLNAESAGVTVGNNDRLIELVLFLIAKESH